MTIKELTEQNLREAVKRNTEKAAGHVTVADSSKLRKPFKTGTSLADCYKGKKRSIRDYIDLRKYE
tara:strand:+ start:2931 stop:3128 length:198 start_codon:yes stop_codon:yes gene_type:complete